MVMMGLCTIGVVFMWEEWLGSISFILWEMRSEWLESFFSSKSSKICFVMWRMVRMMWLSSVCVISLRSRSGSIGIILMMMRVMRS